MQQAELFRLTIQIVEQLKIPYMVVGSAASSIYGDARLTADIDIVIDPSADQLDKLCASFGPEDFYVSLEAARDALARRGQFNVIHPESGNKIDFVLAPHSAWGELQMQRRRRIQLLPDAQAMLGAPEDIILSKMLYYHEGGSEKHLRDIASMLRVSGEEIDREYVSRWAKELQVQDVWEAVLKRLQ